MQDVVIVTGASSGIGSEVTMELADRGYRVLAIAPREKLLRRLYSFNKNIVPIIADLSNDEDINKLQALLNKERITIKCLIHSSTRRISPDTEPEIRPAQTATIQLTEKLRPYFNEAKVLLVSADASPVQKTLEQSLYYKLQETIDNRDIDIGLIQSQTIDNVLEEVEKIQA